jgi:histidinol dehydrogenase
MQILHWQQLSAQQRSDALARPAAALAPRTLAQSQAIIDAVRADGDEAVRRCAREFDGVEMTELAVSDAEFALAHSSLSADEIAAIKRAIANIDTFHRAALPTAVSIEVQPGVRCERLIRPIDSVGLYVPAGSAPLPSTAVMLAVPACIAGCPQRVLCTPPQRDGRANAAVLVAAQLCGVQQVFKIGGAQAVAAMAYGTASVPKVSKIFGPGNAFVTAAKQLVAADPQGAALDLPAGPSEVLIIADETARVDFVAADLLTQAEHDVLSQAILVTTSAVLGAQVAEAVRQQMSGLSRRSILEQSIARSRILIVESLEQGIEVSEAYAPEHLVIDTRYPRAVLEYIHKAGSVFLGRWSPEPMGDYCSGTNHVLPTYGYARSYSGLSVQDFTRRMTVQELTARGLTDLGPTAVTLAKLEGLDAHAAAVQMRLAALSRDHAA